ncbi:hypothetical protein ACKI1I_46375 [Streptomyces turgidiscabies]|uniref:hypothetical protein n=1 Tax=Streptomyces turgidiscabies TaxID=85558 RepID=UPI0038F6A6C9
MDQPPIPEMTVGELIELLSACDRDAPAQLAINPLFPMAHRIGAVIPSRDENGAPLVFIAEANHAEQIGHLPPDVAVALAWHEPTEAPARRRRKATGPDNGS